MVHNKHPRVGASTNNRKVIQFSIKNYQTNMHIIYKSAPDHGPKNDLKKCSTIITSKLRPNDSQTKQLQKNGFKRKCKSTWKNKGKYSKNP